MASAHKKTTLKNGVRLILAPLKDTATVTLLVMVRVGSRYESNKIAGLSHFIEHMMFKGTKKRPNSFAISKEVEGVGAEFNAFTNKEYTGYYIKSDATHLDLVIDVLSDMVLNSKLDANEIKREKGVIIEEINMYKDTPRMYVESLLEQIMFPASLGRDIAGHKKAISGLSRKDFADYINQFYHGESVVIGLAGNFDAKAVKKIENKFEFRPADKNNEFKPVKVSQENPRVKLLYKKTEQVSVALGLPAYSYKDPKYYALQLLSVVLGGNMSSRLFLQIRERLGLAYYIYSSPSSYEDVGALVIQSGLDKSRIDKAITLILSEFKKIKRGITDDELKRAKDYLAGQTALELEDTFNLARWYVSQEVTTNDALTPKQKINKIKAVTASQVKKVAQEVVDFNKLSLAIIGPFKDKKRFEKLIK